MGDVATTLRRLAPNGVDAVFDGVSGGNIAISRRCLDLGGTLVMFGVQGALVSGRRKLIHLLGTLARSPRTSAQSQLMSNRGMKGYLIEAWKTRFPDRYRADLGEVLSLGARGIIEPAIDSVISLSQVRDARERMNRGRQLGKIVLDPWS